MVVPSVAQGPTNPASPAVRRPCTVLLVDDDPGFLQDMRDLLQTYLPGLRILTAPSGPDALQVLEAGDVDLIFSDRNMPEMDGLQFLHAARLRCPDVPRVLLTGNVAFENAIAALEQARVSEVMPKPPESGRTMNLVRRLLSRCFAEPAAGPAAAPA